jgi:hypothetical protein
MSDMVLLENISWEVYEKLLRDRDASGQHFRITYDRGRMVRAPRTVRQPGNVKTS